MKKGTSEPWMPADSYGRSLPRFTINLLSSDLERSARFYREVLGARVVYSDPDFIALELNSLEFMIHADHTYDRHPWSARLEQEKTGRGLGAEMRLFGVDPDGVESRARAWGASVLQPAQDKPHGWRETIISDPDGYAWAVGKAI
jgi:catechol 2,3-dioxygenase-like lactoylglutathione lyase family enzyme